MFKYNPFDYEQFVLLVNSCALRASNTVSNVTDTGGVSLNYVALTFLKGVDIEKLNELGLILSPISEKEAELIIQEGSSARHTRFCQVFTEYLRQAGILSIIKTRTYD